MQDRKAGPVSLVNKERGYFFAEYKGRRVFCHATKWSELEFPSVGDMVSFEERAQIRSCRCSTSRTRRNRCSCVEGRCRMSISLQQYRDLISSHVSESVKNRAFEWLSEEDKKSVLEEKQTKPQTAATLLTTEQVAQLNQRPESEIPEWETPSHQEIDLATVSPGDVGLDPYDFSNSLVKRIYEAQEAKVAPMFVQRATPMITRGVPVIWIPAGEKKASLLGWQDQATTDPTKIDEWGAVHPDANVAPVAKAQPGGFFFFETDKIGIEKDIQRLAGKQLPDTFVVRSGKGGQHFYFQHTPETIKLAQEYGKSYISGKQGGREAWSLRWNNAYVIGPLSTHPETKKVYEVIQDVDIAPGPVWLVEWCLNNHADNSEHGPTAKTNTAYIDDGGDIIEGSRNNALTSILGKKRQEEGWGQEQLYAYGLEINAKRVKPPLPETEVRTIARSVAKYEVVPKTPVPFGAYKNAQQQVVVASTDETSTINLSHESQIPAFDESVITGIYRDIVNLSVGGTTIPRQFAFLNAKVYMGARMAGKVTFEGLDCDSSYYGAAIGETGTSKGESWRRTFEKILNPSELTKLKPNLKVIYSADSGAGLKDAFFEPPTELPMVCYVDEVTTLGHKAGEKKNPEILDTIIELADSHIISRVKAKHGKQQSVKRHDNAHLSVYVCGQDGPAFMAAFAGRTKLGLFDRLYPEFSGPIEAGDLPEIKQSDIESLQTRINRLNFNCKMTMSASTESKLKDFWNSQPVEIRRKIRFKKYLMLDMYMAAFGRGVSVAEPEDLEVAIKIFNRQMVIRQACFTGEVPDRVGFYASKIKAIIEAQRKELNSGKSVGQVAKSLRDFQTMTHAFRDNELHTFERAWNSFSEHVMQVTVAAGNGQRYGKWIPMPYENEHWLTPDAAKAA